MKSNLTSDNLQKPLWKQRGFLFYEQIKILISSYFYLYLKQGTIWA